MAYNDIDIEALAQNVEARTMASDILYDLPTVGFWVRDKDFIFMDISQKASDILYGKDSDYCIGKSDLAIAKEAGLGISEDMFCTVCRGSDIYILDNPKEDKYYNHTFVEIITDTNGDKHIWKTIKGIHPIEVGNDDYYHYGMAMFQDEMLGSLENAEKWFESQKQQGLLEKLNDYLYVYKN